MSASRQRSQILAYEDYLVQHPLIVLRRFGDIPKASLKLLICCFWEGYEDFHTQVVPDTRHNTRVWPQVRINQDFCCIVLVASTKRATE